MSSRRILAAAATRVEIAAVESQRHDFLILRIRDNGCGIPPEALGNPLSIGLVGMRERALLLDGRLEIRSQPESGTTIEMRLPFSTSASQPERKS